MADSKTNDYLMTGTGPARNYQHGMLRGDTGAQGIAPRVANINSNAPYVKRNLVPFLIRLPYLFNLMPNPTAYHKIIKCMIEEATVNIDGLSKTATADFADIKQGGDNNNIYSITNVTRQESQPSHQFPDKYGRVFGATLEDWMFYLGMDPVTKVPLICTIVDSVPDMLPYATTMAVLYVEPSATFDSIIQAYLCLGMFPKTTGDNSHTRDPSVMGALVEYTIEFTATTDHSYGVLEFANRIWKSIPRAGLSSFNQQAAITEIDADVLAAASGNLNQVTINAGTVLNNN